MLFRSNDAAVVLGEYIGAKLLGEMGEISEHTGEESKAALHRFAQAMNEKAEEIGCEDTWFITPNGLDATETLTLPVSSTFAFSSTKMQVMILVVLAIAMGIVSFFP